MWRWLAKAQLSYYCIAPIVGKNRLDSVNSSLVHAAF